MNKLCQTFILLFVVSVLSAQDVIYTISGDYNGGKTPLDSIVIDNITNGSSISFTDLPEHDYYQINITKNSYWGTVSAFDIKESSIFKELINTPGFLSVSYGGHSPGIAKVSVLNVNGQVLYRQDNLNLIPNHALQVNVGAAGMYFVKVELPQQTKTFKIVGNSIQSGYDVKINDGPNIKSSISATVKGATIIGKGNFKFEENDSIRIWAFRKDIFALPEQSRIKHSDDINFAFKNIYYSDINEMAYPDSVGEIVPFLIETDTMYCRKINDEYIFQGDIILSEELFTSDSLKGAWLVNFLYFNPLIYVGEIWPDAKVYYIVDKSLENDERLRNAILYWNYNSPVEFVERKAEPRYVTFYKHESLCSSNIGMQRLNVSNRISVPDWATYGHIMHEMGHTAGLIHEHSRSDRNDFVIINKECFVMNKVDYQRFSSSINIGSFDFESIMLYGTSNKNNDDKCQDIVKKDGSKVEVQRSYLSYWDIKTLEALYGYTSSWKPKVGVDCKFMEKSWIITGNIINKGANNVTEKAIAWKKVGDSNFNYKYFNVENDDFSITLDDLTCGEYLYYAIATNSEGTSTSNIRSKYILPNVSFHISDINENSAKVTLEVGDDEASCINSIHYVLFRSLEDAKNKKNFFKTSGEIKFNSNSHSITFSDLNPGNTYFLCVYMKPSGFENGIYDDDIFEFKTGSGTTTGTFADNRDGNEYNWVKIGDQTWMAENLAYLPDVSPSSVGSETEKHYYVYGYDGTEIIDAKTLENYSLYGVLYNYNAAVDACPSGWHLPSLDEWNYLKDALGGVYVAGGKMKSITGWESPNEGATNSSGFTGLPGGYRWFDGWFVGIGKIGSWYTSFNPVSNYACGELLPYDSAEGGGSTCGTKSSGYSVRCIKNETTDPEIRLGNYYQGGIIFYIDDSGQHGLIAAQTDQSTGINWYNGTYIVTGASGTTIGTGKINTDAIVSSLGEGNYAARLCQQLTLNGYSDWFLPSKEELNLLFDLDSEYKLSDKDYWSSTESGGTGFGSGAWYRSKSFSGYGSVSYSAGVRAIRAF